MKKIISSLFALFISLGSFAYYGETQLTISSYVQRNLSVAIDGIYKPGINSYSNSISIGDLNSGNHSIKLYEETRSMWGRTNTRTIYESAIYLRPGYQTSIQVNNDNTIDITEQPLNNNGGYRNNNDNNGRGDCNTGNDNGRGKRWGHRRNHDNGWKNNDDRDDRNDNNNYDRNRNYNYNQAMSSQQFELLKQSVRNATFDDSKQNVAKQAMRDNYFTASQLKELVQLFSFDDSRLAIAKYGYSYCVDKQNYYVVTDALTFSSSKDELNRYIQSAR